MRFWIICHCTDSLVWIWFQSSLFSHLPCFSRYCLSFWYLKGGKSSSEKSFLCLGKRYFRVGLGFFFLDLVLTVSSAHLRLRARACESCAGREVAAVCISSGEPPNRPAPRSGWMSACFALPSSPFFPFQFIKFGARQSCLHPCLPLALLVAFMGAVAYLSLAAVVTFLGMGLGRRGRWETFVYILSPASWLHLGSWTRAMLPSKCHWLSQFYSSDKNSLQWEIIHSSVWIRKEKKQKYPLQVVVCGNISLADYAFIQFLCKRPCVKSLFT